MLTRDFAGSLDDEDFVVLAMHPGKKKRVYCCLKTLIASIGVTNSNNVFFSL